MQLEIARRRVLDLRDAGARAAFITDHPLGAWPLSYLAMARQDKTTGRWRNVTGTGGVPGGSALLRTAAPSSEGAIEGRLFDFAPVKEHEYRTLGHAKRNEKK
ncbi:MAG: hypothetical protein ACI8Y4_003818 [Candidatus Poriferisodalaceae bacterium]|jgi:hypothetical protein